MYPDCREHSGKSKRISYAIAQIPGKNDEDKFCDCINHDSKYFGSLNSFGVFDGHEGNFASSICADTLHMKTVKHMDKLHEESEQNGTLDKMSIDEIICESVRSAIDAMDTEVKTVSNSGTTSLSLFIIENGDNTHRVICSWVGDSRCILYLREHSTFRSYIMSEDHKPTLDRERLRIEKRTSSSWSGFPIEVNTRTFRDDSIDYSVHSQVIFIYRKCY